MVTLHAICIALSYVILEDHKVLFIISEVLIIASIIISISLYRQLIQPLIHLKEGINAIKDRDFNVKFLPTGRTEMDELIEVYNQMMDALREERTKQQEQHFFLEKLIQTSPTGIVILDYDQQVKQVNPKAAEILGDDIEKYVAQLKSLVPGESTTIKIGGTRTYKFQKSNFVDRGFPRVFIMIEEVTAELFEAEKNAYGKVIRMMAHEVNNTIGPVNSILNQALSMKDLWQSENRTSLKNAVQVAVDRNQNLNHFMRNFADLVKLPPIRKARVELVQLIYGVGELMRIEAEHRHINLVFDLPPTPQYIEVDVQQMEQVLINVVKNAIEAIDKRGTIKLSLDPLHRKLLVSDTGKGIGADLSNQLFTPFFSTKKDGQGIGLTLVKEILHHHGFHFSLRTLKEGETVFEIIF
jgi:two-component system nitrogen regulation sensor histidine kinase NtrY